MKDKMKGKGGPKTMVMVAVGSPKDSKKMSSKGGKMSSKGGKKKSC